MQKTRTLDEQAAQQSSFWARQSRKDKIAFLVVAAQLLVSLCLVLIGAFNDDTKFSIATRLTLLSANIVALIIFLQFAISRFFDDQKLQIEILENKLSNVESKINLSLKKSNNTSAFAEMYIKVFNQDDAVREQYQSTLDAFLTTFSNCIDERRSGSLDVMEYYRVLDKHALAIESDRNLETKEDSDYEGEIWALSFMLDDEWDKASPQENKWFTRLKQVDQNRINTRRLWAFDKKMTNLVTKQPIEDEGRELIQRLALYCSEDSDFKNTTSYAVSKDLIIDEDVKLFGKGFFATFLKSGKLELVRGVCFDNLLSSNSLGGEIDFDPARKAKIRARWEEYLSLSTPLKEYLLDAASDSAKEFMELTWNQAVK